MVVTDQQVRKLLMEYQKTGVIRTAAMMAGMDRKTASGYVESGQLPSTRKTGRDWRTKPDPFEGVWPEVAAKLKEAPELEAKALFEWLAERHPGMFQEGQVRTLQRRVQQWRVLNGPGKEIYFQQDHKPGVRLSTDFTCMNELEVTLRGERFDHLLCHSVLSYSNWQWGAICHSESLLSLRNRLQATLLQLGHNYRHIIDWLLRKPGAFAEYRFRADLFPSLTFRRAYDRLCEKCPQRTADLEYLRILRQAATTMESDVERILMELETKGLTPRWHMVMEFWPQPAIEHPALRPLQVDLACYDALIGCQEVSA